MEGEEALPHRFRAGQRVALVEDRPSLEIYAGDPGTVEALYMMDPPGYEVTFRCRDGTDFGIVCWEYELVEASSPGADEVPA